MTAVKTEGLLNKDRNLPVNMLEMQFFVVPSTVITVDTNVLEAGGEQPLREEPANLRSYVRGFNSSENVDIQCHYWYLLVNHLSFSDKSYFSFVCRCVHPDVVYL